MKLLGANNIVITPIVEQNEGKVDTDPNAKKQSKRFTPGLSYLDAEAIRADNSRRRTRRAARSWSTA